MDRRRFTPKAEGLDSRVLLSGTQGAASVAVATVHQNTIRIERLAFALNSLQPGRVVPGDLIGALQGNLRALVGKLAPASPAALTQAQLQFRSTISHASVSQEDAAALRATFRQALDSAGAPQGVLDDLSANMDRLVQVDSNGRDPAILAANDYALVLQTALGVGRPIRRPAIPSLSPTDDSGLKGDRATTVVLPHLVGRYDINSTVQLLDENEAVLGTSEVTAAGQYSVAPTTPLSLGLHTLRVRAVDANGNFSPPSRKITIKIVMARVPKTTVTTNGGTPAGPLGF